MGENRFHPASIASHRGGYHQGDSPLPGTSKTGPLETAQVASDGPDFTAQSAENAEIDSSSLLFIEVHSKLDADAHRTELSMAPLQAP